MPKPKQKKSISTKPSHPWRPCPLGQHWVSTHARSCVSSKGKNYTQSVPGHCRSNRSELDHLYCADIEEIATRYFSKLRGPPAANELNFDGSGNKYDSIIRGWTRYWNEVLNPSDLLDPDLVKALIASESGFNSIITNGLHGEKAAYGLMQVLKPTIRLLQDTNELRDHLVNLEVEDMFDPNLNICAGIRWLFRKKQIAQSRSRRQVSWRDAVALYKGVTSSDKRLMPKFDDYFRRLKEQK